jgi:hypothetical protein
MFILGEGDDEWHGWGPALASKDVTMASSRAWTGDDAENAVSPRRHVVPFAHVQPHRAYAACCTSECASQWLGPVSWME